MNKLDPCPFCGGKPSIISNEGTNRSPYWAVMCYGCGVEKENNYNSRQEAIDDWNKRIGGEK